MARQTDRYSAGGAETEFEPGSRGRVLRNLLGIRSAREMAAQESSALLAAAKRLAKEKCDDQRFSAQDIRGMHRAWLGEIYPWAGAAQLDEQARAIGIVHAELVLIHPFREGNGRCARLLAILMGLQAGLPPLDFTGLEGRGKRRYFAAIQAALGRDYAPVTSLFRDVIVQTVRGGARVFPA